jgi:DNA polymerase I-like protein with 3'-5' exonuclease and polymerase domains
VTRDLDTGEVRRYHDDPNIPRDGTLLDGVRVLQNARLVVFHNGVGFDTLVLKEFYDVNLWYTDLIYDTLVASHLFYPRIADVDKIKGLPSKLVGRHSLAAWGHRLGVQKGEFGEQEGAFNTFSEEMLEYCVQDTVVTAEVYNFLETKRKEKGWPDESVALEHAYAWEMARMMDHGFPFDRDAAERLMAYVRSEMKLVDEELHALLGPVVTVMKTKTKTEPVNLNSTMQIVKKMEELWDYEHTAFSPESGRPQFDGDVILGLPDDLPIKPLLLKRVSLEGARKRLEGDRKKGGGLLDHAVKHDDGNWWIHHYSNHNGARTGRNTHSHPNINMPRVTSPWGKEFRGMVRVPDDMLDEWTMVGIDMSGVDARMIAHYIEPYDDGKMIRAIVEEDIHAQNAELIKDIIPGIQRNDAKNPFYATAYGGGAKRVGLTLGVGPKKGGQVRRRFREAVYGLDQLIKDTEAEVNKNGFLVGLDGRILYPEAAFSAVNCRAQGGAAVVMKEATVRAGQFMAQYPSKAHLVIHLHDEGQFLCKRKYAEDLGILFVECIKEAGVRWNVKCPLDGEYKIGDSWAETH